MTCVACIDGLHYISVGQLCLPLGRAGLKALGLSHPSLVQPPLYERETQAREGSGFLEISGLFGGKTALLCATLTLLGLGEMVTAALLSSLICL